VGRLISLLLLWPRVCALVGPACSALSVLLLLLLLVSLLFFILLVRVD